MRLLLKTQDMSILSRLQIQYTSYLFQLQLNTSGISEYIAEGYEGDAAGDIRKRHCLAET
jgi:hypothetical protein